MDGYVHPVQYYETDMMGITHHANYIHWMEEARIDFMARIGFPYAAMEAGDVYSPVKSVRCDYRRPCTFGDQIAIDVSVASFNGVIAVIRYRMTNLKSGELICTAESEHCFLNRAGAFVRLKRVMPDFFEKMTELAKASED